MVAAKTAFGVHQVTKRLQHAPVVEEPEIVVEEPPKVEEPAEAVPTPSRFSKIISAMSAIAASALTTVRKRLQRAPAVVVPGDFRVYNLRITPNRVKPGEIVNVFAEAINASPVTSSYSLVLRIKGMVEAIKDVNLSPGQSQKVAFSTLKDKPGVYDVDLEGLKDSFTVEG